MSNVLCDQVLVLNRLWQAVHVCSVRRALTLLFEGDAQVVFGSGDGDFRTLNFQQWRDLSAADPDADSSVGTVSFRIRVPRVIRLLGFDRFPKKEVKFTRHNLFERDRNTCQYCGRVFDRRDLNLDHVIPRDRGGTDDLGKHRVFVHPVQHAQGQPDPGRGAHAPRAQAQATEVAPVRAGELRGLDPRQLAAFLGCGVLECRTRVRGRVSSGRRNVELGSKVG